MWRIYYGDGAVVSDADSDPYWVPPLNVQVVWVEVPQFSGLLFGADCYWWCDGFWRVGDDAGLWQYLFRPGPQRIIYGTTIADSEFQVIRDRAVAERQDWRAARG